MGIDAYTALLLMQHLLRILQYLQTKNIIHNDVKGMENVLLLRLRRVPYCRSEDCAMCLLCSCCVCCHAAE